MSTRNRHGRRQHHGLRLQRSTPDVSRRHPASLATHARSRSAFLRTWTSARTTRRCATCPMPGPGAIQPRRPIPQLATSPRFASTASRSSRRSRSARTAACQQASRTTSYTLSQVDGRRLESWRDSRRPTCRRTSTTCRQTGEGASSFDHRHPLSRARSTSCRRWLMRCGSGALLGEWHPNAIFIAQTGAPFTVNLGVDRANIGAGPAQRPDQLRDPNLTAAPAHRNTGSTRRRSRCQRRSPSAARLATA